MALRLLLESRSDFVWLCFRNDTHGWEVVWERPTKTS